MATVSRKTADAAQIAKAAPDAAILTLSVCSPSGRRFRAGLEFGVAPRVVEVSAEQALQIKADPLLSVSSA